MYKILIVILFVCISCYKQEKINIAHNKPTEKKLEKVYAVDANTKAVGYLYKYQWENTKGTERNHYFVCDLSGTPIGYIGDDGNTVKFDREKNVAMGNYDLDLALKKIFDTNQIKYRPLVQKSNNNALPLAKNDKLIRNSSSKREEPDEYDDEYSDDEYNDDEYENDGYKNKDKDEDDEYEDDEY